MGERVGMIALEGFEHLLQLTGCPLAGRSPHCLPRFLGYRSERTLVVAKYQMAGSLSSASQELLAIRDHLPGPSRLRRPPQARVEQIPQAVSQEVDPEHRQQY